MHVPRLGLCLTSLALLSACFSLGQKDLPAPPEHPLFTIAPCTSVEQPSPLKTEIKQRPLHILSTAKTPWDTHLRYVYPFTRHTVQFEVTVTNQGNQVISLEEEALLTGAGESIESLPLAFFEKAWPANAVQDAQQLHDRSMAMGEVIEHRWHTRQLFPGESYTGWLSFPVAVLEAPVTQLQLRYRGDASSAEAVLSCALQAERQASTRG